MTAHERCYQAITDAGIPAWFGQARPTAEYPVVPDRYAVYYRVSTVSVLGCDNDDRMLRSSFRVDVYDAEDPEDAVEAIITELKSAGFMISAVRDLTEFEGTGYRAQISCSLIEDRWENE